MNTNHTIAVIGGTGKSGKYVVQELVSQGYKVKMLVRNPGRVPNPHPLIEIIHGDVLDQSIVNTLLDKCDAVISTLGWGIPPSSNTISSEGTTRVLEGMKVNRIKRLILISGVNVDVPGDIKGIYAKSATSFMYENFSASTVDKQNEYELLKKSEVLWTLVRLPMISMDSENKPILASEIDCPSQEISATSLAKFLIRQIDDLTYLQKAPFIANR